MTNAGRAIYISIAFCIACATFEASAVEDCDSYVSNMEQVQCIARGVKKLDKELNNTYQAALAALPEKDNEDSRKEREQLRKSQRAWLKYKDENCTLIGGLQGGNNLWVTHFSALCEVDSISERIKFLKGIANGTGNP